MCTEKPEFNLSSGILYFVALFILILITWYSGGPKFRFSAVSALPNPLLESQFPPIWEIRGPFGNIDIGSDSISLNRVSDGDCSVLVPINISDFSSGTLLRLRADLEIDGDRDLQRRTHYMHLYAIFYRTGEVNGGLSIRQGLPQHRHKPVYSVFRIPPDSDGLNLVLQCGHADDSYRFGNLRLEKAEFALHYKVLLAALLLLWGGIVAHTVCWLARRVSWKIYLPLALGVCALAVGIAASKPYFVQLLDPLHTLIVRWVPLLKLPSLHVWFKIGHLVFFSAIALVLFFNHQKLRISIPCLFASLVLLAFATEAWQMHFLGRSSRIGDVIIDVAGVLVAYFLVRLWQLIPRKPAVRHTTIE